MDWELNAAGRDRLVLQELRSVSYLGGRAVPWGGAEPSLPYEEPERGQKSPPQL